MASFYEPDLVSQAAAGEGPIPEAESLYAYLLEHRIQPDGLT